MRIRLDLDAVLAEPYDIVHADSPPIFEAEQGFNLQVRPQFSIDRAGLLWRDGKSTVVTWQKLQ